MKKTILYTVATVIAVLAPIAVDAAERTARPSMLPPHEIVTIVRSAGLSPLGQPARKGGNYLLRAIDEDGQEVRVVVDGRVGEVVSVTPVTFNPRDAVRGLEPSRPSVYDSGPPVYDLQAPPSRAAPPVVIEDDSEPPVYRRTAPMVPAPVERDAVVVVPEAPNVMLGPPLSPPGLIPEPAPRTLIAPPPVDAAVPPEGDDQQGLLPPPPPRFQQRVNVTPPAKPAPKPKSTASKSTSDKSAARTNPAKTTAAKTTTAKTDAAKSSAAKPNASSGTTPAATPPPTTRQN